MGTQIPKVKEWIVKVEGSPSLPITDIYRVLAPTALLAKLNLRGAGVYGWVLSVSVARKPIGTSETVAFEGNVWSLGPRRKIVRKSRTLLRVDLRGGGKRGYVIDCELDCGHFVSLPNRRSILKQRTAHCAECRDNRG